MESWADHCSSDEEEIKRVPSASAFTVISDDEDDFDGDGSDVGLDTSNHNQSYQKTSFFNQSQPPPQKSLPDSPPFTAFMNNLSYEVTENELANELQKMCLNKRSKKINIVNVRFATDRETRERKGFGYVEVETRDELVSVLELNPASMFGRKVKIDIAQNTRKQSNRNNNHNNSYHNGGGGGNAPISRSPNNSMQQSNTSDIDGSKFRGGMRRTASKGSSTSLQQDQQEVKAEVKPRQRLKLAPRTKPSEKGAPPSLQSSIFGTGKKRDDSNAKVKKQGAFDTVTEPAKLSQKAPKVQATSSSTPKIGDKATNTKPSTSTKPSARVKKGTTNSKSSHATEPAKLPQKAARAQATTSPIPKNGVKVTKPPTRVKKGTTNSKSSHTAKDTTKKYESPSSTTPSISNNTSMKKNKRSNKKTILVKENGWTATAASDTTNADANPVITTKKVDLPTIDDKVKSKATNNINVAKNHFAALGLEDDDSS